MGQVLRKGFVLRSVLLWAFESSRSLVERSVSGDRTILGDRAVPRDKVAPGDMGGRVVVGGFFTTLAFFTERIDAGLKIFPLVPELNSAGWQFQTA